MKLDEFTLEGLRVKIKRSLEFREEGAETLNQIMALRRRDFWSEVDSLVQELDGDLETALGKTFEVWLYGLLYAGPQMLSIDQAVLRELAIDSDIGAFLRYLTLGQE